MKYYSINEFSKIFFGNENSDRTMIYLKSNKNQTVYSTINDLYPYLTTKLEIFSSINPEISKVEAVL